ncbi:hypothetical protein [Streptomyces xinghaiensis]|uniref:hypothetical protein n=1 Tax=Streptomyces xinghaiensis TaxID=1038928 RepID=UPI002E144210|nr:hypothetical protein OG463_10030 [Streptomyces xinghaiensis]
MTDPYRRLRDALGALDAAFAPLTARQFTVEGCTYCYPPSWLEALGRPAHLVPEEMISSVASEVPSHWDDFTTLYRRMTPRIVRLLVTGRLHVDHGLIASRLLKAGWRDWSAAEREALEEVWHAWWRSALSTYPGVEPVTGPLETIAVCTGTTAPWLDVWARTRTEAADRHLHDTLDDWLFEWQLADLRLGFYDELHATPELLPWLVTLEDGRIGAAQLQEVEHIAYS